MDTPLVVLLERHADVLWTMGREDVARAVRALAQMVQITKIDSVSDLERWVGTMEADSGSES